MLSSRDYVVALLCDPAHELQFLVHELLFLAEKAHVIVHANKTVLCLPWAVKIYAILVTWRLLHWKMKKKQPLSWLYILYQ